MKRRVFVTGIGLVSPHGCEPQEVFRRLYAGESAIRKVRTGTAEYGSDVLLAPCGLSTQDVIPKSQSFVMDRVSKLAVVAAYNALNSAGLLESEGHCKKPSAAVYMGCGLGGSQSLEDAYRAYWEKRTRKPKPTSVPMIMANAPAAHISMRFRLNGPSLTYSIACASSAVAVGEAFRAIRDGYSDVAVAGGTESMINDGSISAWEMLGVLAKEHESGAHASSRPFAVDRTGFVLGEGAAVLILESEESVLARETNALAEVVGYGVSNDAHNLTQPAVDGQVLAMRAALSDASLEPLLVDYINAHATATPAGDLVEVQAIKQVFGEKPRGLAISSTKSMHGHLVGAAGALEFLISVLALAEK